MGAQNSNNQNSKTPDRVVQSSAAKNPLIKSDAETQRVFSQKCSKHTQQNADLLYLKQNVRNPRICLKCVQENGIQTQEYLQIKEILLGSTNSDSFNDPVLNNHQLQQEIQTNYYALDSDKNLIDYFYNELLKQIQIKIETKKQMKQPKILELEERYQRSMVCWSEFLDIDKLKRILYESNNESKLILFINAHIANSDNNTRRIREICGQFKAIQSQFSIERPNQIQNMISSLLDQINFFDNNNPSTNLSIGESYQFRNELQLKQQEVDQLQEQLRACRIQMQEQQLSSEKLRVSQSKQIYELKQQLREENGKNIRLKDQLEHEKKSTQSSNKQQQQPFLEEILRLIYFKMRYYQ